MNGGNDPLKLVISFVLQFLPLLMIPYAFRLAGGLLGRAHELMTNYHKRGQEAIKGNVNDQNSMRNVAKRRFNAGITANQAKVLNAAKDPNASGFQRGRARFLNTLDGRVNERQSRFTREAGEIANMISSTGNDDDLYAANWYSVKAGEAIPDFVQDKNLAGTTATKEHFFNSKGKEINESYAKMAEGKLAANANEAGRSLEYPVRKIQTDEDMANFRQAFAATAVRRGMDDGEIIGTQAASTFEHKDKFPELWYSTPHAVKDASGRTTGVRWDDVGDDTPEGRANMAKMTGDMYNTRQGFQLGSVRAATMRSMEGRRARIQTEMDANMPISQEDAKFFVHTEGVIDQMIQKGVITRDGEAGPEMSASGATPATQDALRAMAKNTRYRTRGARVGNNADGTPILSPNEHVIYKEDHVNDALNHGGTTSRDDAIDAAAVPIAGTAPGATARSVQVTGDIDRSTIPRSA